MSLSLFRGSKASPEPLFQSYQHLNYLSFWADGTYPKVAAKQWWLQSTILYSSLWSLLQCHHLLHQRVWVPYCHSLPRVGSSKESCVSVTIPSQWWLILSVPKQKKKKTKKKRENKLVLSIQLWWYIFYYYCKENEKETVQHKKGKQDGMGCTWQSIACPQQLCM